MEINGNWFGILNASNVEQVAEVVRRMIVGKHIAIAEARFCDGHEAHLDLIAADCEIDSRWATEPVLEPVRVFKQPGMLSIGFSAGGYSWVFRGRQDDGHDHEDYYYAYFKFEHNKFTVTERAPAGKGYLHKRVFGAHSGA